MRLKKFSIRLDAPEVAEKKRAAYAQELLSFADALRNLYVSQDPENAEEVVEDIIAQLSVGDLYLCLSDKLEGIVFVDFSDVHPKLMFHRWDKEIHEFLEPLADKLIAEGAVKVKCELPSDHPFSVDLGKAGFGVAGIQQLERLIGATYVDTVLMEKINSALLPEQFSEDIPIPPAVQHNPQEASPPPLPVAAPKVAITTRRPTRPGGYELIDIV